MWPAPTPPPFFGTRGCKCLKIKDTKAKKRAKRLQLQQYERNGFAGETLTALSGAADCDLGVHPWLFS